MTIPPSHIPLPRLVLVHFVVNVTAGGAALATSINIEKGAERKLARIIPIVIKLIRSSRDFNLSFNLLILPYP
jgi:hypothetical protein